MPVPLYKVDAFTSRPFYGNPAAICLLDTALPETFMQSVAAEMALSETAFLLPENDGYRLRWFTPLKEVRLCGHATLASAHILWETQRLPLAATAYFYTLSGQLSARHIDDWIELNFPARHFETAQPPAGLLESLGVNNPVAVFKEDTVYIVELQDEDAVRACHPDFLRLLQVNLRSVAVTAPSAQPGIDIVSRYFAPSVGVNEDPVTGSIHCGLAPYWSRKLGKTTLTACQASARGGILRIQLAQDRVLLAGQAVTVMNGNLVITPAG